MVLLLASEVDQILWVCHQQLFYACVYIKASKCHLFMIFFFSIPIRLLLLSFERARARALSVALKIHKYNQGAASVALGVINTAIYKTVCVRLCLVCGPESLDSKNVSRLVIFNRKNRYAALAQQGIKTKKGEPEE
jgi:hypothetical protein